jgi:hypothetical protein
MSAVEAPPIGRAVLLIILGVAALCLKRIYQGPYSYLVQSYLGNVSASFAVYFLATIASARVGKGRFLSALSSLLVVEAFELSDGFAVMSNVYDPWDLLANAIGVGLAFGLDTCLAKRGTHHHLPAGGAGS